jgi:hypothetical protein
MCAMSPRLLRPVASGFNPKTIAGLVGWWDADDASTITLNGSDVSEWRDKSGNGRHVAMSTAANQPAYAASSLNGRAGIDWGAQGSSKRLSRDSLSLTVRDFFIVADWDGGATFSNTESLITAIGVGNPIGGDGSTALWRQFSTSDRVVLNNGASSNVALPTIASPFVLRSTYTSAAASAACTAFHFGQFANFSNRGWGGEIYEVIIYDSSLSSSAASRVQKYLASKWGITLL